MLSSIIFEEYLIDDMIDQITSVDQSNLLWLIDLAIWHGLITNQDFQYYSKLLEENIEIFQQHQFQLNGSLMMLVIKLLMIEII